METTTTNTTTTTPITTGGISNGNPVITSQNTAPVPDLKLPKTATDTTIPSMQGIIDANKATTQTDVAGLLTEAGKQRDISGKAINTTMQDIFQTTADIGNVENGIDRTVENKALQEATNYTNQIEAEQNATRRAVESLQKNNPQGLFGGALQDEVNRLNRDSLSKQADLAILFNASNRNYNTAVQISEKAVKMKLQPLQTKLDNLKFFYAENKELFNKNDDRIYATKIKEMDRKLDLEAQKEMIRYKSVIDTQQKINEAKATATTTGVPAKVAEDIVKSTVGQKVNAGIGLIKGVNQYIDAIKMYQKATVSGVGDADARANLGVMKQQLDLAFSSANQQGVINAGDQKKYDKIILQSSLFPEKVLSTLETFKKSAEVQNNNNIQFLDAGYSGYASRFFEPQLQSLVRIEPEQVQKASNSSLLEMVPQTVTTVTNDLFFNRTKPTQ